MPTPRGSACPSSSQFRKSNKPKQQMWPWREFRISKEPCSPENGERPQGQDSQRIGVEAGITRSLCIGNSLPSQCTRAWTHTCTHGYGHTHMHTWVCMHTCTHTHAHVHMTHTHARVQIHLLRYAYTHAYAHTTYTNTHMPSTRRHVPMYNMHVTPIHTSSCAHKYTCIHMHTHMQTCTCAYTPIQLHTHVHRHAHAANRIQQKPRCFFQ